MDRNAAKLALQAYRPNGKDAAHPLFTEALALMENDPELKRWWKAQHDFDRKVAAKLGSLPLPDGLRATILSGRKIEKLTPRHRLPYWLAAAASVAFLLVAGLHPWNKSALAKADLIPRQEYTASVVRFLDNDPALGLMANDQEKIGSWLHQQNSPLGKIPANMAAVPPVGCQKIDIRGHLVSMICFSRANGDFVHLFIIDRRGLSNPPGPSPEFSQNGSWATAMWSDGTRSYILATQAGPETLRQLL